MDTVATTKGSEPLPPTAFIDEYVDRLMYQTALYGEIGRIYVDHRKALVDASPSVAALMKSYADGRADLVQQISAELLAWRQANPDQEGRW